MNKVDIYIYKKSTEYILSEIENFLNKEKIEKAIDFLATAFLAVIAFYFSKWIGSSIYNLLNIETFDFLKIMLGFIFINITLIIASLKTKRIF